mgnify:CR=1 FL=1
MSGRGFAVIPAAGMGKRMGASINKQYLLLAGKPIVAHTLELFQNSGLFSGIILVIPDEEIPYCRKEVVEKYNLTGVTAIVAGGAERQNSVMNGLKALQGLASDDDIVVIHDGVRPFIEATTIAESMASTGINTGSLVAVPAKDTIKVAIDGIVRDTPDRTTLCHAQTPQTFRFADILNAHRKAEEEGFLGTDDCSLLERYGGTIRIVRGSYMNIKITTPEDLLLGEAFLKNRQ